MHRYLSHRKQPDFKWRMWALWSCRNLSIKGPVPASSSSSRLAAAVPGNVLPSYPYSSHPTVSGPAPVQSGSDTSTLGAGMWQRWQDMAVTCGSLLSSLRWLVLNSCSAPRCGGEAVKFFSLLVGVWWHMAHACCPHCWFFLKTLQTKIRVIILSLSLKANFWDQRRE